MVKQLQKILQEVREKIAFLRENLKEPAPIHYGSKVDIEIAPCLGDDRVIIRHTEFGCVCVNYTEEGLIIDVFRDDEKPVSSVAYDHCDLMYSEK